MAIKIIDKKKFIEGLKENLGKCLYCEKALPSLDINYNLKKGLPYGIFCDNECLTFFTKRKKNPDDDYLFWGRM